MVWHCSRWACNVEGWISCVVTAITSSCTCGGGRIGRAYELRLTDFKLVLLLAQDECTLAVFSYAQNLRCILSSGLERKTCGGKQQLSTSITASQFAKHSTEPRESRLLCVFPKTGPRATPILRRPLNFGIPTTSTSILGNPPVELRYYQCNIYDKQSKEGKHVDEDLRLPLERRPWLLAACLMHF